MELKRNVLKTYEMLVHTTVSQEETQEAIVPDACPDMQEIITTCGQVCLNLIQAKEGQASLSGMVDTTVMYRPENGVGIEKMSVRVPFQMLVEVVNLTADGGVCGIPKLAHCEARLLNPRKILVKVEVLVAVTAYQPVATPICCDVDHGYQMEGRVQGVECYPVLSVQQKPFTYDEIITLQGQGELGQLLSTRITPICAESKTIGTKLIYKGEIVLEIVHTQEDGTLGVSRHQLPFSQIMEVSEFGDEGAPWVDVVVESYHVNPVYGGERTVEISLDLVAQAVVRGNQWVEVLEDCYSTTHQIEVEYEPYRLVTRAERFESPQSIRQLFEVEENIKSVLDSWGLIGEVVQNQSEGERLLVCPIKMTALCVRDDDTISPLEFTLEASTKLDCPDFMVCLCDCSLQGEVYTSPTVGGIEVRLNPQFQYILIENSDIVGVSEGSLGEERPRNGSQVILRMAQEKESLWEIAKGYGTTIPQIVSANELAEEMAPVGQMLLIPSMK